VLASANARDVSTFAPGEEELKIGMRKESVVIPGNERMELSVSNPISKRRHVTTDTEMGFDQCSGKDDVILRSLETLTVTRNRFPSRRRTSIARQSESLLPSRCVDPRRQPAQPVD
jgi:hypothetical protein